MRPWQRAGWCLAQAPRVWSEARPLLQRITRQAKKLQGLVETEPLSGGVMLARDCEALGQGPAPLVKVVLRLHVLQAAWTLNDEMLACVVFQELGVSCVWFQLSWLRTDGRTTDPPMAMVLSVTF